MTDFAGDDADGAFGDAPGDAGDGLVVGGVPVQHAGGEVAAEGHAGEPVVGLESVYHSGDSPLWSVVVWWGGGWSAGGPGQPGIAAGAAELGGGRGDLVEQLLCGLGWAQQG